MGVISSVGLVILPGERHSLVIQVGGVGCICSREGANTTQWGQMEVVGLLRVGDRSQISCLGIGGGLGGKGSQGSGELQHKLDLQRKGCLKRVQEDRCRTGVPQAGYRMLYTFLSIKIQVKSYLPYLDINNQVLHHIPYGKYLHCGVYIFLDMLIRFSYYEPQQSVFKS